jgi:GAF domain-containing protein
MHPEHRHGERADIDVITGAQSPPVDEIRDGPCGGAPVGSGRSSGVEEAQTQQGSDEIGPWSTVEQLVRTLRVPAADSATLVSQIVGEAVRIVPAAREAGLIVTDPDRNLNTVFASGPAPRELDDLQIRLGTGPCLTAARKQIVVRMHDVAADTRWPEFCRAAQQCAVGSMLCVPLFVDDQMLGTLSFYGGKPDAFRNGAEPAARVLATLAAVALADSSHRERIERALGNRDLIGQAKGIIMCRYGVHADEAFEVLRRRSQRTNRKLLAVAEQVVETGMIDGVDVSGAGKR